MNNLFILKDYKEPLATVLSKYGSGHGYMGTISTTSDYEYIQCHICGKGYRHLAAHAQQAHKISAIDYRVKFGIARKTPLCSDKHRERIINSYNDFARNLTNTDRLRGRTSRSKYQPRLSLETDNKRGTCPDQVIEKIRALANELGHAPSPKEYKTRYHNGYSPVIRHFGNWKTAIRMAGLIPKGDDPGIHKGRKEYSREELLNLIRIFYSKYKRTPSYSDFVSGALPTFKTYKSSFETLNDARKEAGIPMILRKGNSWVEVI